MLKCLSKTRVTGNSWRNTERFLQAKVDKSTSPTQPLFLSTYSRGYSFKAAPVSHIREFLPWIEKQENIGILNPQQSSDCVLELTPPTILSMDISLYI